MHERLFETQGEWSGQQNPTEQFTEYAGELELDTDAFVACLESGETGSQVQAELEEGEAIGVGGVPAFFINDWFVSGAQPFEVFQQVIEAALRGEHPPPTPTPLPPGVTPFDPNPERPGHTYGGDVFRGSEEAEVSLIGFIDFQSPENRKHVLEVWPELEKEYVGPGKVRLIVKHFPARDHLQGLKAAEAAECAGQQDAFWTMHDLLFQRQEEWSQLDEMATTLNLLEGYAAQLGLDGDAFVACMDEGQTGDKVKQDLTIAQQNQFPPAPQFFIFNGQRASYVPLDQLRQALEQSLTQ
jgi:protein-disulfide isomerase